MRFTLYSLIILLSVTAYGQTGGNSTYGALNLIPSARVGGLAGATLAHTEGDLTFGFWNPALLKGEYDNAAALSYSSMPSGIGLGEAAYAFGIDSNQHILTGFRYFDYGSFVASEENGTVTGTFRAADYILQGGYGYELDSNWQFGGSLKFINSAYEQYNSFGMAMDLSAVYQIPKKRFAFALMAKNIGVQLSTFSGNRESLPFELQAAISNKFEYLPFRWTVQFEHLETWDLTYLDPNNINRDPITGAESYDEPSFLNMAMRHVTVSGEIMLGKSLRFGLGYNFRRQYEMALTSRRSSAGLTFGLAAKLGKFWINYSNVNMNVAGRIHQFTVAIQLDEFKKH